MLYEIDTSVEDRDGYDAVFLLATNQKMRRGLEQCIRKATGKESGYYIDIYGNKASEKTEEMLYIVDKRAQFYPAQEFTIEASIHHGSSPYGDGDWIYF